MSQFQQAPTQAQQFLQENGTVSFAWRRWFDLIPPAITAPGSQIVPTAENSPATKSGTSSDEQFFYVMTPSGKWKKIPLLNL